MAEPYREIYRGQGASAGAPARGAVQMHQSPQLEFIGLESDLGDPAAEPEGWHPMGWVANRSTSTAEVLRERGAAANRSVWDVARDLAGAVGGVLGEIAAPGGVPPPSPMAPGAEEAGLIISGRLPTVAGISAGTDCVAGYVTTADGRRIPVPCADPQARGEKALSDVALASIRQANVADAYNRGRLRLQEMKQFATEDQWAQTFALDARAAAQKERIGALQERALELALEKETASPAQRALWGRPSKIDTSKEPPYRRILAIGSGLPGGVIIG